MLYTPIIPRCSGVQNNWLLGFGAPTTPGTNLTCGTADTKGSWTFLHSIENVDEVYAFDMMISNLSGTGNRQVLMDIGVNPSGADLSGYITVISNISVGNTGSLATGRVHRFYFPYYVPSGGTIAARAQCSQGTALTMRVALRMYGGANYPEGSFVGRYSETLGITVGSSGTVFVPGNGVMGNWTKLGTTTNPLQWWQLGYNIGNATITAETTHMQLGYGGEPVNKPIIGSFYHTGTTSETIGDDMASNLVYANCYCPVPSGTDIYIRGACQNAPDSNYLGSVVGIGG